MTALLLLQLKPYSLDVTDYCVLGNDNSGKERGNSDRQVSAASLISLVSVPVTVLFTGSEVRHNGIKLFALDRAEMAP